jgi:hypothetical protein
MRSNEEACSRIVESGQQVHTIDGTLALSLGNAGLVSSVESGPAIHDVYDILRVFPYSQHIPWPTESIFLMGKCIQIPLSPFHL